MMTSETTTITAANDNRGGPITIDTALFAFVTTLARAYARELVARKEPSND